LPLANVTVVPYAGTIAEFLLNPHYAQQAYAFSEPLLAKARGGDPRCLLIAESGFDPYASVLVTRDAMVRDHPDLVRAVTAGAALGWRRYLEDPAPANALILAANPALGAAVVAEGARVLVPLARTPTTRVVGEMTADRWTTLVEQLNELGLLETVPPPSALWNGSFLPGD
jgi:NitT/TauT family transport system substrate-binding protein